jgi:hypothetical protein
VLRHHVREVLARIVPLSVNQRNILHVKCRTDVACDTNMRNLPTSARLGVVFAAVIERGGGFNVGPAKATACHICGNPLLAAYPRSPQYVVALRHGRLRVVDRDIVPLEFLDVRAGRKRRCGIGMSTTPIPKTPRPSGCSAAARFILLSQPDRCAGHQLSSRISVPWSTSRRRCSRALARR